MLLENSNHNVEGKIYAVLTPSHLNFVKGHQCVLSSSLVVFDHRRYCQCANDGSWMSVMYIRVFGNVFHVKIKFE